MAKYSVSKLLQNLAREERNALGKSIANVIVDLNEKITKDDLQSVKTERGLERSRDNYYATTYNNALQQDNNYASMYVEQYGHLQSLRPNGSDSNIIVFGDLSTTKLGSL